MEGEEVGEGGAYRGSLWMSIRDRYRGVITNEWMLVKRRGEECKIVKRKKKKHRQ